MNHPAIDPLVFEALQANAGAEFVGQLVEAFADEAPQLTHQMRVAAAAGDETQFETIAHGLKSNGVTFGALRLTELAARLERRGLVAGDVAGEAIAVALDELAAEVTALVVVLRAAARL